MPQSPRAQHAFADTAGSGALSGAAWTCPFCALHCDGFAVEVGSALELVGSDCPKARAGLAQFSVTPSTAAPRVGGNLATLDMALDAAAALLARSHQPLIAGLATDVAGMRAAFRLAEATGAIVDHLHGDAIMHAVRAIQDRGVYYTTLAEIRNRSDLMVCIGTGPSEHYPEFFRRCGLVGAPSTEAMERRVVFVGAPGDTTIAGAANLTVDAVAVRDDLYATLAALAALAAGRSIADFEAGDALRGLARDLRDAHYAVIVWEPARLGAQGALAAEAINTLVSTLNRTTRAASFALSGSDGAYTANQVMTWLSGMSLRTGFHPGGLAYEPLCYGTERLLRDASVDALVWISSFGARAIPPRDAGPAIVLGHPALGSDDAASAPETVFIPVSTPGIGSPGHLFRLDGGIALPLRAVYADALPTVAQVLDRLIARLPARAELPR